MQQHVSKARCSAGCTHVRIPLRSHGIAEGAEQSRICATCCLCCLDARQPDKACRKARGRCQCVPASETLMTLYRRSGLTPGERLHTSFPVYRYHRWKRASAMSTQVVPITLPILSQWHLRASPVKPYLSLAEQLRSISIARFNA